jgi:hypothetical protein
MSNTSTDLGAAAPDGEWYICIDIVHFVDFSAALKALAASLSAAGNANSSEEHLKHLAEALGQLDAGGQRRDIQGNVRAFLCIYSWFG